MRQYMEELGQELLLSFTKRRDFGVLSVSLRFLGWMTRIYKELPANTGRTIEPSVTQRRFASPMPRPWQLAFQSFLSGSGASRYLNKRVNGT